MSKRTLVTSLKMAYRGSATGPTLGEEQCIVFSSKLGWMGLETHGTAIWRLSFGHCSAIEAKRAIGPSDSGSREPSIQSPNGPIGSAARVVELLKRYADGEPVDFGDLPVDLGAATDFRTRVLSVCRQIAYGQVQTYGELAAAAGAAGAARAVGNCMAGNRIPLIIPCHRVVRAGGDIGPYSAAGGSETKRRLLTMESLAGARPGSPRQTSATWARLSKGVLYT